MKMKSVLSTLIVLLFVLVGQTAFSQPSPEQAIAKLQVEVLKFQGPDLTSTTLKVASVKTPPSYYVKVMENMIQRITETKNVNEVIQEWEAIGNAQTSERKNFVKEIVAHVKSILI